MSEKKVCPFCGSDKIENHRYNTDDKGFIWYDHFVCLTCGKEGFEPSDRKSKTTEDIVPPFELCKRLPEGAFADSVLVHVTTPGHGTKVWERIKSDNLPYSMTKVPAPTLAEIMLALAEKNGYEIPAVYRDRDSSWYTEIKNSTEDRYHNRSHKDNAASAALMLWLDLEGGK